MKRVVAVLAVIFGLVLATSMPVQAKNLKSGYFGFMTNDPTNSVTIFVAEINELVGTFPTGGNGSGASLGSQGSVAVTEDGNYLLAVNAGSNNVSVLTVEQNELEMTGSPVSSGGTHPISVAVHRKLAYVLNAGGVGSIAGFRLHEGGLTAIPGSIQPLGTPAPTSKPAQVLIDKTGHWIVVPHKGDNKFSVYHVDSDGVAGPPVLQGSVGLVPFGAMFDKHNNLLVSEAASGAASSYHLNTVTGVLTPISSSVVNGQLAACWLVVTKRGDVYTTNTASNDVSLYDDDHGALTLVAGVATLTGPHPIDMAVAGDKTLYVLTTGNGMVDVFAIGHDGALTYTISVGGATAHSTGMFAN